MERADPLPKKFVELLQSLRSKPENFAHAMEALWRDMNTGGYSPSLQQTILQFNGGLFADCAAIPLNIDQLELLIESAKANWSEVEPAIFGTLLERALDSVERHKLGAHYTPHAYVERLVTLTAKQSLRKENHSLHECPFAFRCNSVNIRFEGGKRTSLSGWQV